MKDGSATNGTVFCDEGGGEPAGELKKRIKGSSKGARELKNS